MLKRNIRKLMPAMFLLSAIALMITLDITQARKTASTKGKFQPESAFDALTEATAKVAIVRSDYKDLPNPTPVDDPDLTYEQIEEMTREAIRLSGGLAWLIHSGDKVLIKPNIVDPEPPGVGEITDVRVIKAVVKIVDEIAPGDIEIIVGEASPREMDYELKFSKSGTPRWTKLWDVAGYQDLLTDPDLEGINLRLSNLNGSPPEDPWQDLILVEVPGGGYADHQAGRYWMHKDVLDADVFITVPVMKIHNPGITVALKNQIGIAPSTRYGFSKSAGIPQDDYATRLIHYADMPRDWVEEEIVDLCAIADIDFVVVDATACLESSKSAKRSGDKITNLVRRNMILAGPDPVAIDHVCARLMGLNPDDVAHITLAAKKGLGVNDSDRITVVGSTIEASRTRFKKDPYFTSNFGQSNRTWLLRGPFDAEGVDEPMDFEFIPDEAHVRPEPNSDGWSAAIYFFDDRIDLDAFYEGPENRIVSYAFAYVDAPKAQTAELWTGSSEAMRITLNGDIVYTYLGNRPFGKNELVLDKVPIHLKQGENTLLVKTLQSFGSYDFTLNICEPESDPDYDGDRVMGLTFRTEPASATAIAEAKSETLPSSIVLRANYPNPFNTETVIPFDLPVSKSQRKMDVELAVYNIAGQRVRTLLNRPMSPGHHRATWDGKDEHGRPMPSGVYLCRLQIEGKPVGRTLKMSLLK